MSSAAPVPADLRPSPTCSPRVLRVAEASWYANSSNTARVLDAGGRPRVLLVGSSAGGRARVPARVLLIGVGTCVANILANPAVISELFRFVAPLGTGSIAGFCLFGAAGASGMSK